MKSLLSIGEAAQRLGLSVDTVRELENSGELRAVRTPGGHRRFKPEVLDAYASRRSGTRSTRRAEREAPPQPARRRNRMRRAEDEPPDLPPPDGWDEEPFELPEPPKPQQNPVLEQARTATNRFAEEMRISNLKAHGRARIPWNASATAHSAVIDALDEYVTDRRFPASVAAWEARRAVEAKVGAIMEPYTAEAARQAAQKAKAEARELEKAQSEQRQRALIERGKMRALTETMRWDYQDREDARADVERAMKDEVESDWTDRDVDDLVDEVLDEWEEDDENDDEDED